jgi:hypothetical protein
MLSQKMKDDLFAIRVGLDLLNKILMAELIERRFWLYKLFVRVASFCYTLVK